MSNIDRTDYTFSNIDWSALPADALAAFNQVAVTQPAPATATMTAAEAEAAAALAGGGIPLGRPAVEATAPVEAAVPLEDTLPVNVELPDQATPTPTEPTAEVPITEPPPVPTPAPIATPAPAAPSDDAVQLLRDALKDYGLEGLADDAYKFLVNNPGGTQDEFLRSLRGTDLYKTRFAGNAARVAKGLPELTPSEYVGLENNYRNVFQAYSIPTEFYDETSDFQKLIEGNVDTVELRDRVANGYTAVRQSSPEVIKQMETLYGVNEAQLAAYFLDPTRGANILKRQAEAVQVSAAAKQAGGIQLGATMAERLAAEGVTAAGAREGFATIAQQRGLFQPLMQGEQAISEEEQIGATFGLDAAARQRIETRRRRRQAEFAQGGGFAETAQGVIGLRTVGE
jgi:hypothetical protein